MVAKLKRLLTEKQIKVSKKRKSNLKKEKTISVENYVELNKLLKEKIINTWNKVLEPKKEQIESIVNNSKFTSNKKIEYGVDNKVEKITIENQKERTYDLVLTPEQKVIKKLEEYDSKKEESNSFKYQKSQENKYAPASNQMQLELINNKEKDQAKKYGIDQEAKYKAKRN